MLMVFVPMSLAQNKYRCSACNGKGRIVCKSCKGQGYILDYLSMEKALQSTCRDCNGVGSIACAQCREEGYVPASRRIGNGETSWFKKTTNKCKKCNKCTGYWGTFHTNNTYEGPCANTDALGIPCGHSPKQHGLKEWTH